MNLAVLHQPPPMYADICAVFPAARDRNVIFTWGEQIYAPGGAKVSRELQAHERVHCERQLAHPYGVVGWWRVYLLDPSFRLEEELPAHVAEYQAYCKRHGSPGDRNRALSTIAERLASPLYGGLLKVGQAKDLIMRGGKEITA